MDIFLGGFFNTASYSLLTLMVAQVVDMMPGDFVHTVGDAHIYNNHFEQVDQYLAEEIYPMPTIKLNPEIKEIDDFKFEDIELVGYKCGPIIKAPVAV